MLGPFLVALILCLGLGPLTETAFAHRPHDRPHATPQRPHSAPPHPYHAAPTRSHPAPPACTACRATPHHLGPTLKRSTLRRALRKQGLGSRRAGGSRAPQATRGLRTLPRTPYPTDLRSPTEVDGRFLRPIDGDTFAMNGIKIRMSGLNAPELGTPGSSEAAHRLAALLQEGQVTIVPKSRDIYGRTVADVFMNGQNLADRMIAEGFARRG